MYFQTVQVQRNVLLGRSIARVGTYAFPAPRHAVVVLVKSHAHRSQMTAITHGKSKIYISLVYTLIISLAGTIKSYIIIKEVEVEVESEGALGRAR